MYFFSCFPWSARFLFPLVRAADRAVFQGAAEREREREGAGEGEEEEEVLLTAYNK